MAYSSILINFTEVPAVDQVLNISETTELINFNQTFKIYRSGYGQTEIPYHVAAGGGYPERFIGFISENFKTAIKSDIGLTSMLTIEWFNGEPNTGIGSVLITANFFGAVFELATNTTTAEVIIENVEVVENNYSASPSAFVFDVIPGGNSSSKQLIIKSLSSWSIDGLPSWLQLSATAGTGNAVVDILPIEYDAFPIGTISSNFDVITPNKIFTIDVDLNVFSYINIPFKPGEIYFTKELNYISFNSLNTNSYIEFDFEIKIFKIKTYEPVIVNRKYKFPLFQGSGDFHVGSIVHDFFNEIDNISDVISNFKTNFYQTQYRPAEVKINIAEKSFDSSIPDYLNVNVAMFKMAKGNKPFTITNQLALLTVAQQEITRITPNSIIGTSFLYIGSPRIVVKKNEKIIEDFTITPDLDLVIYSYYRFNNNLIPGDSLEIIIINDLETRIHRFLVFQNGLENTYFFFENDNQMLEPFEFTGRRKVSTPLKHITTPKIKNLFSYNAKVKTEINQTFTVNSGYIGKSDHNVITALTCSPNVWCSFDNPSGPYFKVDAITTKIENQDTSVTEEEITIEFNILENANASIYPR